VHLNVPPPGEPQYKQISRRIGWSILAVIAPELVALNAWLQYRGASELTRRINRLRGLDPPSTTSRSLSFLQTLRWVGTCLGKAVFALLNIPDWLRMTYRHRKDLRSFQREQRQARMVGLHTQLDEDILPWTISTTFYAISGAVILVDDYDKDLTMGAHAIFELANSDAAALRPIQRAALQDSGKASVLAKVITCAQAFWFCSQCIARLSQNMAISLIELNTFAHCISAFFIYAFWWHKPYDVEAHVYIDHPLLLQEYLLSQIIRDTRSIGDSEQCDIFEKGIDGKSPTLVTRITLLKKKELSHRMVVHQKIKPGATIPGTGFTLLQTNNVAGSSSYDLALSHAALVFWKRLWRLRYNLRLRPRLRGSTDARTTVCLRARNLDEHFIAYAASWDSGNPWVPIVLTLTFLTYGGVHLLAWQYNFQTKADGLMWKIASVTTASSGLILVATEITLFMTTSIGTFVIHEQVDGENFWDQYSRRWRLLWRLVGLAVIFASFLLCALLFGFEIIARSFLIIESFRALPNSPSSVYEIPRWTAYLPHL